MNAICRDWKHLIEQGVSTCQTTKGRSVRDLEFFQGDDNSDSIIGIMDDGCACAFYADGREQYWVHPDKKRHFYKYGDLVFPETTEFKFFPVVIPDWVSLPVVVFFLCVVFAWLQIFEDMRG